MMHFTIFGGTEAKVAASGFTAVTMFGGADLQLPTMAERILHRIRTKGHKHGLWSRLLGQDRSFVLTMFGATEFIQPTVAEEYAALRSLVTSGAADPAECRALAESFASGADPLSDFSCLTLFAGCSVESPSKKKQAQALDAAENTGAISHPTRRELDQAVGCPSGAAADIVSRLAFA